MDILVGLAAVIVALDGDRPLVRLARGDGAAPPALPFGPLDPVRHRTLDSGLRAWVEEQTGLTLGYVEQLYTFGDKGRDPRERQGGPRVLSIAYLALTRAAEAADRDWRDWYDFFPWEDRRAGRHPSLDQVILPGLEQWSAAGGAEGERRRQRIELAFGTGDGPWDGEKVLERYELLYEAALVAEAAPQAALAGRAMRLDHRRILATAIGRLRAKIRYRPVVFELMSEHFTLLQLQRAVEALGGERLHKQNFRRLVEQTGLVEGTGRRESQTGGRPAEQFRFRRDVLLERPAPGVAPRPRRGRDIP